MANIFCMIHESLAGTSAHIMIGILLVVLVASTTLLICAEGIVPVQVVPGGLEPVNGSDTNMGCTNPLVGSGGWPILCPSDCLTSFLLDGNSPDIDTSTSDWASQLVTVRKRFTDDIPFQHALLTFGFDTAVSLTGIELDLFICPEWNIGAPYITVFANEEHNLSFSYPTSLRFENKEPTQLSCNSLSTISIPFSGALAGSSYSTWYILVSQLGRFNWVHVGEIRFLGTLSIPGATCSVPSTTVCVDPTQCPHISPSMIPTLTSEPGGNGAGGTVAAVVVVLLLVTVAAVVVSIGVYLFIRRRDKHLVSSHSDADLGRWQNVVSEPGGEFQNGNNQEELLNNHNIDHLNESSELPNYFDLENQLYCSSVTARKGYPTEGLYDEVTKEDLGAAPDTDYEDASSSIPQRSEAIAVENVETVTQSESAMHVYSHVQKKETPTVPQKSSDLMKYLATQDVVKPSAPPLSKRTDSLPQPKLRGISENPVYEGSREALETHAFDLYDRPRKASLNSGSHDISHGFDSGMEPQPSAPPLNESIYNEPIKPSDFKSGNKQEKEVDPHIYAPVYAVPTMLPEGFQQPVEITNDNIIEKKELGIGQFGKVILAATNGLSLKDMQLSKTDDNRDISILVAVKKMPAKTTPDERERFEKEVKFMSCLKHQNVVSLIGVCYHDPAFIMMEYMEEGDLSQFLQRYSDIVPIITHSGDTQITISTLVYMASQIASAMQYLAAHNYIHRDLASRNCLVGGNFTVKLADFGMSRSLYQSHYYRIQGNAVLPIRWMATESFFGIFSEKSDVWAFGVTMWELFTLAKEDPYSHLTDTEVVDDAIKGVHRQLLLRPKFCPKSVYKIMQQCWVIDPKGRVGFKEVEELLQTYWYTPDATM